MRFEPRWSVMSLAISLSCLSKMGDRRRVIEWWILGNAFQPYYLACKTRVQMVLPAVVLEALRQLAPGGFEDRLAHQVLCAGGGRLGGGGRVGRWVGKRGWGPTGAQALLFSFPAL